MAQDKNPILKNQHYDTIKWIALILLPALGTAYFSIAQIWGLPYAEEVVGTIVIIEVLAGALLQVSSKQYEEAEIGTLYTDTADLEGLPEVSSEFTTDPTELADGDIVKLRVKRKS